MNQRNLSNTGNMNIGKAITADQVGFPDSEEHLTGILESFNYEHVFITIARINLLLQCCEDFPTAEGILQRNFCSRYLRDQIDLKGLDGGWIFGRQSSLHLLSESVRVSDPLSTRTPNGSSDAKNALTRCYLIANKFLVVESSSLETDSEKKKRKELLVGLIQTMEYAIYSSLNHRIRNLMVRTSEFLCLLQGMSLKFDVNEIFSFATGLTLQEYQYLIFGILRVCLSFSPNDILSGESLLVNTQLSPTLTSLYEKLIPHTCISIDELGDKVKKYSGAKNEFLVWRKYPLVKISENQILCIDIGFLLDKLQTGVFWTILEQLNLNEKSEGDNFIASWGEVFARYASSILKRAINGQSPTAERCIINPEYDQKQQDECTDIVICGKDTLILLECKTALLRTETKFSGDFDKFYAELREKIIIGDETEGPKGVKQLCNAIESLTHLDKTKRQRIDGIDICKIKKIYPVLVLSDRIFSVPCMNWLLNSEFRDMMDGVNLMGHVKVMPLTVLTIEDIELLEPYLSNIPFHVHLNEWIAQFSPEKSARGFSAYLYPLIQRDVREDTFMDQKHKQLMSDVMDYFSSRGLE